MPLPTVVAALPAPKVHLPQPWAKERCPEQRDPPVALPCGVVRPGLGPRAWTGLRPGCR
jgi:hypothetical protein